VLQTKQGSVGPEEYYPTVIQDLVTTEILPAKRDFQNRLQAISDEMFGSLVRSAVIAAGDLGSRKRVFGVIVAEDTCACGGVGDALAAIGLNAVLADRAAKREMQHLVPVVCLGERLRAVPLTTSLAALSNRKPRNTG
jgi:hypothetical protein